MKGINQFPLNIWAAGVQMMTFSVRDGAWAQLYEFDARNLAASIITVDPGIH